MIAKRYAQALFELGKEENVLDILHDELKTVGEILDKEETLQNILNHPQISGEQKKEIWITLFQGKAHPLTLNFLLLLTDRKREGFLAEIIQQFEQVMREEKNIGVAQVITAIELTEEQKTKLQEKLTQITGKENMELETKVNHEIIGGIIVKVGNLLMDDSIVSHLASLRKKAKAIQLKGIGVNG